MSTLTNYNGLQIVTPNPTGPGGLAINRNFQALSTHQDATDPAAGNDSTQSGTLLLGMTIEEVRAR